MKSLPPELGNENRTRSFASTIWRSGDALCCAWSQLTLARHPNSASQIAFGRAVAAMRNLLTRAAKNLLDT